MIDKTIETIFSFVYCNISVSKHWVYKEKESSSFFGNHFKKITVYDAANKQPFLSVAEEYVALPHSLSNDIDINLIRNWIVHKTGRYNIRGHHSSGGYIVSEKVTFEGVVAHLAKRLGFGIKIIAPSGELLAVSNNDNYSVVEVHDYNSKTFATTILAVESKEVSQTIFSATESSKEILVDYLAEKIPKLSEKILTVMN